MGSCLTPRHSMWLEKTCVKPVERYLYQRSKEFSAIALRNYLQKYILKYLRKRQKLGLDVHLDDNILNVISEEWTSILTACDSTDDNEIYFLLKNTGEDIGKRHDAYVNTLEDSKNLQVTSTSATRHDPEAYPEVVCTHEDIAEVSICFD